MGNPGRLTTLTAVLLILAGAAVFFSSTRLFTGADDGDDHRVAAVDSPTDRDVFRLQQRVTAAPQDLAALNALGFGYLQKARESGDPSFYSKAGGIFQQALAVDSRQPDSLLGASSVSLTMHDFPQALQWAQRALGSAPDDPDAYGAMGDALVELGRYDDALDAFQKMLDARPDLNAYVRVAYLRELHGDIGGAIEAMRLAVEASRPAGETAAWVRSQLGHLYFNTSALDQAASQYEASLDAFPGYVHALAGLARVAGARGDYGEAITLYTEVTTRQPVLEYVAALGDAYRAAGRGEEAQRQYELVAAIDSLYRANGIDTGLEIAVFLADHNIRLDEAVAEARSVYEARPGSIRAADVLSWALYKAGAYDEALVYTKEAVRLGTQDPLLLFHAGMINYRAGNREAARDYIARALEINPGFSVLYSEEAANTLQELRSAVRE